MKHFYILSKTFLMACGILLVSQVRAQSSTSTAAGNCGVLVQNFNTTPGGHASPSIFGGTFDSAFYYNGTLGLWTEMDGGRTDFFLPNRIVTIISPPYANPNPPTTFDVGFWFQTSSATADRFQVRLVAVSPGPAGTTITNIVASSGAKRFADWATSYAYKTDAANPANSGDTGRVCIRLIDPDITNGPNTFYRVEIAFVVTGTTYAAYDNLSIGPIIAPAPLPVNFIGIVAKRTDDGNGIRVRWDVADESDVMEYQLERSTNGASFTTVGTVPASGRTVYGYTDPNGKVAVVYYRVKSVDNDGSVKYSGIIKMVNNDSYSHAVRVYPTPAQNQITVQHMQLTDKARITIATSDGRTVKLIRPVHGTSNTMIDISALSAGLYLLRLDRGDGKVETVSFIKQ